MSADQRLFALIRSPPRLHLRNVSFGICNYTRLSSIFSRVERVTQPKGGIKELNPFKRNRVVITTMGSLGDLNPYIALALEMKKRFIEPVIATSDAYRERVESLNIEFHPIRPAMATPDTPEYFERVKGVVDPNHGAEYLFKRLLVPAVRDTYQHLSAAIEGAD